MKKILISIFGLLLLITAFFTFPLTFDLLPSNEEFPREESIALITNEQNKGESCKANVTYSTEKDKGIHKSEDYEFTVNDFCADIQNELISAIEKEDIAQIRKLISLGANVNTSGETSGESIYPIHKAAYKNANVVKLLLDNGADINKEHCCCMSCFLPLKKAVLAKNTETVKLLLERGADINYQPQFSDEDESHLINVSAKYANEEITGILKNNCEKQLDCRVNSRYRSLEQSISNLLNKSYKVIK